jgi:hypothetical protein
MRQIFSFFSSDFFGLSQNHRSPFYIIWARLRIGRWELPPVREGPPGLVEAPRSAALQSLGPTVGERLGD